VGIVGEVEAVRFEEAFTLHRQGRIGEAEHAYQAVLDAEPEHVEARLHLGAVLLARTGYPTPRRHSGGR
jgi:thioredoxin-like negative regulator of GroEL